MILNFLVDTGEKMRQLCTRGVRGERGTAQICDFKAQIGRFGRGVVVETAARICVPLLRAFASFARRERGELCSQGAGSREQGAGSR